MERKTVASSADDPRSRSLVSPLLCLVFVSASLSMCLLIEWQNHKAGSYMPRTQDPYGKWRAPFSPDVYASRSGREATAEEWREYEQVWAPRNKLRSMVQSLGLPQYLMLPVGFFWAVANLLLSRPRSLRVAVSLASLLILFGSGVLIRYRDYAGSLEGIMMH